MNPARGTFWQTLGASLSLANLLAFGRWDASQDQWYTYFRKLPDPWYLVNVTLQSIAVWSLILFSLWLLAGRTKNVGLRKATLAVLLFAALFAADVLLARSGRAAELTGRLALPLACGFTLTAITIVWFQEERAWKVMRAGLLFLLPLLPVSAATTVWSVLRAGPSAAPPDKPLAPLSATAPPTGARVLWIVFDELDYDIAFAHRPANLRMPEFDRLRQASFFAQQAIQPGHGTEVSIPAFLVGHTVRRSERQGSNELMLGIEGESKAVPWSRQTTVFTKARRLGFDSSVTGFFHPYCRVVSDLAACYWQPFTFTLAETAEYNRSPLRHLRVILEQPWLESPIAKSLRVVDSGRIQREKMRYLYEHLLGEGKKAAVTREHELVYVHMPLPHPPGYWSAASHQFSDLESASYVDNLELVDRTLGEFRATLEQAGLWDRTSLIVTSDHPLRPGSEAGTRNSFKASGEANSRRVPFLVRLAGQQTGAAYPAPFHSVMAGDLSLAILKGEIHDEQTLEGWIGAHEPAY